MFAAVSIAAMFAAVRLDAVQYSGMSGRGVASTSAGSMLPSCCCTNASSWSRYLAKKPETLEIYIEARYTTSYRSESFDREPTPIGWRPMTSEPKMRVWSDDYADVLSLMRIKEIQKFRHWLGLPTVAALRED